MFLLHNYYLLLFLLCQFSSLSLFKSTKAQLSIPGTISDLKYQILGAQVELEVPNNESGGAKVAFEKFYDVDATFLITLLWGIFFVSQTNF